MSRVLVTGSSALNIARSLAAFSFACSGVSFAASASFFFAVLVSVAAGLTGAAAGLVSSAQTTGASHAVKLRQMTANVNRAAESFGLFTRQCLAAPSRGEKRNLGLAQFSRDRQCFRLPPQLCREILGNQIFVEWAQFIHVGPFVALGVKVVRIE